ncbi:MAG: hypothetical protein HKN67_09660, partial [Saprospiraceae bacterium]|nr:hypothetical protein [Saprospiraceae bacterium]
LKFEPGKILKNKNSFLGRTLISSRYRIDQKSSNENAGSLFRFVNFNFDDTVSIVSNNAVFDHNIFFNRGNPSYDVQLSYRTSENKFVQISGFERRSQKEYYARSRINLKRKVDAIVELRTGIKEYDSQNFDSQDFNIDYYSILPQVNYRPSTNLRIVGKYNFTRSKNMSTLEETSLAQDLGIEITWRQGSFSNLQFSFNFVNIDFTGQQNSPVEFEMLQGLKDGKNYLWQLNYTRRISNSIDLILNYDGRKSESNALINTAGVQLRAVF